MVIFDRIRELHDDIVFRHYPGVRENAPFIYAAMFLIVFATALGNTYFGDSGMNEDLAAPAKIEYPVLGATLRLSRISGRPERPIETLRAKVQESEANDPRSPMLIDIDPESGAVHASAGSIEILGSPINIGNWPLD